MLASSKKKNYSIREAAFTNYFSEKYPAINERVLEVICMQDYRGLERKNILALLNRYSD